VKCCDTVLRGNYTAHKRTKKHIRLHQNNEDEQESPESYQKRQIDNAIKYHQGGRKLNETKQYDELSEKLKMNRPKSDTTKRNEYIKRVRAYGIDKQDEIEPKETISDSELELSESEPDERPIFETYDDKLKETIRMLYKKAKNIYKQPLDLESRKKVKFDLKQFKSLIDGEILECSERLADMIIYYSNLN
jgi:hypothetical protein